MTNVFTVFDSQPSKISYLENFESYFCCWFLLGTVGALVRISYFDIFTLLSKYAVDMNTSTTVFVLGLQVGLPTTR